MTASEWFELFALIILIIFDAYMIIYNISLQKDLNKAKGWIHKLISGDNVEMSIETLSIVYGVSEERIDQLLTMEKEYRNGV